MYTRSTLFIAAALLVGSAVTAGATDIDNGGWAGSVKDAGNITDNAIEAIPVPGAIEIPETVSWYLRGDLNYGFASDVDVTSSVSGIVEPEGVIGLGVGFGRYLSPSTRMDFTFNYRRDEEVFNFNGTRNYNITRNVDLDANPVTPDVPVNYILDIDESDYEALASHTALVNFYYDFDRMNGFRPYVGAGAGIAIHEVTRRRQANVANCQGFDPALPGVDIGCGLLPAGDTAQANADLNEDVSHAIGFALAGHAGFSVALRDNVSLDAGYTLTYQSSDIMTSVGINDILVDDRIDHEIRIGLRYDIW